MKGATLRECFCAFIKLNNRLRIGSVNVDCSLYLMIIFFYLFIYVENYFFTLFSILTQENKFEHYRFYECMETRNINVEYHSIYEELLINWLMYFFYHSNSFFHSICMHLFYLLSDEHIEIGKPA